MQKRSWPDQIKRMAKAVYLKIFRINDSPMKIALGFGLGVFVGVMPGVGPVVALLFAFLFRVNRASALLGSILFNTWLGLLSLFLAIKIGAAVSGLDWQDVYTAWGGMIKDFRWEKLFELSARDVLLPIGIGYLIISLIFAAVATVVVYMIVLRIRNKKSAKSRERGMRRAVFLDRDGTINEDVGYLFSQDRLKFVPRVIEAMLALQEKFDLFVVTNQAGIGEKAFTIQEYHDFESRFEALLAGHGIHIRHTYCCPHIKADGCLCRKPSPYFLNIAVKQFDIDLTGSYVIGDHPHDIEMGKSVGAMAIYVLSGHGEKHRKELAVRPDLIAGDLYEASMWILEQDRKEALSLTTGNG